MNRRQKIIMLTVGIYVAGFVGYLAVNSLWLAPSRKLSKSIEQKRTELTGQETLVRSEPRLRRELAEVAARTLGYDETVVRERVRERLMALLGRSGLGSSGLSLDLFDGLRRDAYREVGATVRASGRLDQVVGFLYLLQSEPVVHRVENLSITPARDGSSVDLRFRYATFVLDSTDAASAPTTMPADAPIAAAPRDDRKHYEAIVARDLFRPYIKRPRPPRVVHNPRPRPQPETQPNRPSPQPAAPEEDSFRVVGLPTMAGEAQVHLHDPRDGTVRTYSVGDRLGRAKIAAVDYRRMRWGEEYSTSRVVLIERGVYWAVELGDTIGQKRPLEGNDLPRQLRTEPTSAPADDAGQHARG